MCELLHTSLVVQKMQGGQKPGGNWQLFGSGTCWGEKSPAPWRPGLSPYHKEGFPPSTGRRSRTASSMRARRRYYSPGPAENFPRSLQPRRCDLCRVRQNLGFVLVHHSHRTVYHDANGPIGGREAVKVYHPQTPADPLLRTGRDGKPEQCFRTFVQDDVCRQRI